MKLVEILAREIQECPKGENFLFQDYDGEVWGDVSGETISVIHEICESPRESGDDFPSSLDDDWCEKVTRAQWEAERARILAESSKFTEQDKEHIAEENREAEDFAFEKWCRDNEYDCRKRLDGSGYSNPSTARAFLAWKASRNTNVWQRAVDEQLVSSHLGVAGDVCQIKAHALLGELIDWHVGVATDPKVNGGFYLSKSPAYEQELWDKVAALVAPAVYADAMSEFAKTGCPCEDWRDYVASDICKMADAFMAERAKRMKR